MYGERKVAIVNIHEIVFSEMDSRIKMQLTTSYAVP
jgi:hypothetical protein